MPLPFNRVCLPAGADLFREGEAGTSAFVIESGEIEIWVRRNGAPVTVAARGPGDVVGEMAIVDDGPRSASATARSECCLFEVSAARFRHRTAAMDPVMRSCLTIMIDRLRATMAMIEQASAERPSRAAPPASAANAALPLDRLLLEREIERAFDEDQFELHYQPIVALAGGTLAGYEALARWRHPDKGYVSPARFVPVAEESGMIGRLTRWAARRAIEDRLRLFTDGTAPAFVSINVSASDLGDPSMADDLGRLLAGAPHRGAGRSVTIEVTESAFIRDPDRAIATLAALRDHGFSVAIDDFGTGYSSLSYLARMPASTVKIDRSFVWGIEDDPAKLKIARTIVTLARELGMKTVAEGIETKDQARILARLGCDFGQGYLYAPARRIDDICASPALRCNAA